MEMACGEYAVNTLAIPHVECKAHLCVSHNVTSVLSEYDLATSRAHAAQLHL